MQPLIIANWKANKTKEEALDWLNFFKKHTDKEFVLCPPFTLLDLVSSFIKENQLKIKVGAQDVSDFSEGPFTGEVTAEEIRDFAEYVLIGHSERRRNFGETQEDIKNKIEQVKSASLKGILCISDIDQLTGVVLEDLIVAYEPIESIGSQNPEDPKSAEEMALKIKKIAEVPVLYGGSVNEDNVSDYTKSKNIDGVLVGGESLTSENFFNLLQNA